VPVHDNSAATPIDAGSARRRLGLGAVVVLVVAALAITVVIGIVRGATAPVDTVVVDATPSPSAADSPELYVHISGAVQTPGLYVLPPGSRVVDAIAAAGGFVDEADRDAVNLARTLADGEQLPVPREGELPATTPPAPAESGQMRVNLNTADATALEALPRIGPALAERIIAWREDNSGFTSIEDLLAVPGIGDKMLESLRDLVTV